MELKLVDEWKQKGIQNHTIRKYLFGDNFYYIDKTSNGVGRGYGFYSLQSESKLEKSIIYPFVSVFGEEYFGDGWKWKRVEKYVSEFLNKEKVN